MKWSEESGFTLIELLVTVLVFSIMSVGFYQVMFSGSRGADTTADVVRISEEARAGFNRLVRDTREASGLAGTSVTGDEYTVEVDFNGDGVLENPNPNGDYEIVTFTFDGTRLLLNGELLVDGVDCIRDASESCTQDVFAYGSNHLEYDWDGDGVTTGTEIDGVGSALGYTAGNRNGVLDLDSEKDLVSEVSFAFSVQSGSRQTEFFGKAQLRNRR